jgi:U3 small nucleolar RNA-associated protein MPP10
MEEVLPMGVSQADAQAPGEVHSKKRGRDGLLRSADEVNSDERKRVRGVKKAARRKERRSDEAEAKLAARVNPGLGNPYEKRKLMETLRGSRNVVTGSAVKLEPEHKSHMSSAKFFEVLADEQKTQKQSKSHKK